MSSVSSIQPLLLSVREAAAALGISPRLLASLTASGSLPSIRVRSRRLYAIDDLRWFIAQQKKAVR